MHTCIYIACTHTTCTHHTCAHTHTHTHTQVTIGIFGYSEHVVTEPLTPKEIVHIVYEKCMPYDPIEAVLHQEVCVHVHVCVCVCVCVCVKCLYVNTIFICSRSSSTLLTTSPAVSTMWSLTACCGSGLGKSQGPCKTHSYPFPHSACRAGPSIGVQCMSAVYECSVHAVQLIQEHH